MANLFKKIILIISAIFVSIIFLLFWGINKTPAQNNGSIKFFDSNYSNYSNYPNNSNKEITQIFVEIADTPYKQSIGLMNRKKLEDNSGMFFIFNNEQIREFWMKNTLIPLDMIFLDKNFKIVNIVKNATPCKILNCEVYSSLFPSKYVIEVNSGFVEKYNLTLQTNVIYIPKK